MSMGVGQIFTFQRLQQETASSFFWGGGSGQSWALRRAFRSSGLAESRHASQALALLERHGADAC